MNALAVHLTRRGHQVTILCRTHVEPPAPGTRFVTLHRPTWSKASRIWAFARDVERHLQQNEYDVVLGLGRTWSQDVVRTGGGTYSSTLELARRFTDTPLERWLGLKRAQHRAALEIERRAFAPGAYRKVIANSRMVLRDLVRRYAVRESDIELIYNGVDLARFRPASPAERPAWRAELGLAQEDRALCFVGSGFARKGLDRLIAALPEVARAEPRLRLIVVGAHTRQSFYAAHAQRLGLADRVQFLGARRDPERIYAACDLTVLPTWYDSFGFSVLESMACGVPVVTTAWAGASELVEPGQHGEVVPGDADASALARAILAWLVSERCEAARAGLRARAEEFGFERTLAQIESVLERAAAERALALRR